MRAIDKGSLVVKALLISEHPISQGSSMARWRSRAWAPSWYHRVLHVALGKTIARTHLNTIC